MPSHVWFTRSLGESFDPSVIKLILDNKYLFRDVRIEKYWTELELDLLATDRPLELWIDRILIMYDSFSPRRQHVTGFALITMNRYRSIYAQDKCWYIELICAKKSYGQRLMNLIKTEAILSGITLITLSALLHRIPFFDSVGFSLGNDKIQIYKERFENYQQLFRSWNRKLTEYVQHLEHNGNTMFKIKDIKDLGEIEDVLNFGVFMKCNL